MKTNIDSHSVYSTFANYFIVAKTVKVYLDTVLSGVVVFCRLVDQLQMIRAPLISAVIIHEAFYHKFINHTSKNK